MTDRLDGIHALITGAASGIGAACARRMVRDGAQLLLADVNGDGAKTLADELRHQASLHPPGGRYPWELTHSGSRSGLHSTRRRSSDVDVHPFGTNNARMDRRHLP